MMGHHGTILMNPSDSGGGGGGRMIPARPRDRLSYLSVVQWPDTFTEQDRIDALVEATEAGHRVNSASLAIDDAQARLILRRGVPAIVRWMHRDAAKAAEESLSTLGVAAYAIDVLAMGELPEVHRLRAVFLAEGGAGSPGTVYAIDTWKEVLARMRLDSISLIVRGWVTQSTTTVTPGDGGMMDADWGGRGVHGSTWMATMGPEAAVLGAMFDDTGGSGGVMRESSSRRFAMLDLWDVNGQCYRVESKKFDFSILGKDKTVTNIENIDRLAVRFAKEAPRAVVDTNFASFRCPPDIVKNHARSIGRGVRTTRDDVPGFDLYSSWLYLVTRRMMGG
ncbi:MAG: hypothetical protein AB7V21_01215 [Phycisphaerales bacterium]